MAVQNAQPLTSVMARYLTRDRLAILAALVAPLAVAAILLPFRSTWSNTNVALLLVVVVVVVAVAGSRSAAPRTPPPSSCFCSPAWPCRSSRRGPGG
jgi:hypothetical protein